ncbi:hypothetical protein [Brevundimonas sp. UBA5936]|uniref:hypothetical protein n=1 Tax=Brevundimonas sp. UBA5936 TaxID=1946133 RepID=UPI0025C68CDD|nr:hypothetical protein [Brevundimonas sp. UBA5936]
MTDVLEQVFPSRIEAIAALRAAAPSFDRLKAAAAAVREAAAVYGRAPAARIWTAFADGLDCIAQLEAWRVAVLSAEVDADRHLRAAQRRFEGMEASGGATLFETELRARLRPLTEPEPDADGLRSALGTLPMPIALFADPEPQLPSWAREPREQVTPPPELAVAFLAFAIDGRSAERIHWLAPQQTHDLKLEVKVSRWPEGADRIRLSPVSVEPARTFDLPTFEFDRPSGPGPYTFSETGRMVLHTPQALEARPYEFLYAAEFSPLESEQPVVVAGQRILRLNGSDPRQNPITGYPGIDRKLIAIRDQLRREPRISEPEAADVLQVLAALGNLMGQAVQDARYPQPISEAAFQDDVRQMLRGSRFIGVELEEQAHAAGGRTDLSYRGVRIELKSERVRSLTLEDCKRYAAQAATYAIGTNRLVGVLCVLDATPKTAVPFPVEDGIEIVPVETATSPVYVAICLVQGGLPRPSDLSR